jgi:hypothetical protein
MENLAVSVLLIAWVVTVVLMVLWRHVLDDPNYYWRLKQEERDWFAWTTAVKGTVSAND